MERKWKMDNRQWRSSAVVFSVLFSILCQSSILFALGKISHGIELDPYYSDVFLDIPFQEGASEGDVEKDEAETYRDMLVKALVPRFLTLEASVNPLPITGVAVRKNAKRFYQNAQVNPSLNLVEAVTADFQEPYALSAFLGKVIDFNPSDKSLKRKKKGYVGLLASVGGDHIMDSLLIADKWLEVEWKVKGDLETEARKMSWSFRVGSKFHEDSEITDVYYLGIRRNRVDYKKTKSSLFFSSGLEYRMGLSRSSLKPISHYLMLDKNFPIPKGRWVFSLGLGYLWRGADKYNGFLVELRRKNETQILIRPNIKF